MSLQQQLDEVINQMASAVEASELAGLEQKKAVLTMQIEDAKTQEVATQERIQAQVEKVESITLPYDFNEVFGDPRANEMIIELIKDLQHQAYGEHNAEVEVLVAENKAEVSILKSAIEGWKLGNAELKNQNDLLISENVRIAGHYETEAKANDENLSFIAQLKIERDDAFAKRDAAVAKADGIELLLSEKEEHIKQLRMEIAIGAKAAVNVTNISPSDRLAALVQESKSAKVKSALDIALENATPFRGKVISDGAVVQLNAPEEATFRPVDPQAGNPVDQLVTGPTIELPTVDQEVDFRPEEPVQAVPVGLVEGNADTVGEAAKTLEERVKALELHVFGA